MNDETYTNFFIQANIICAKIQTKLLDTNLTIEECNKQSRLLYEIYTKFNALPDGIMSAASVKLSLDMSLTSHAIVEKRMELKWEEFANKLAKQIDQFHERALDDIGFALGAFGDVSSTSDKKT